MVGRPQSISINPDKVMKQGKPDVKGQEEAEQSFGQDKSFTTEDCKKALQSYIASLGPNKKHNLAVVWSTNAHRIEGNTIHIIATSRIQASLLEEERSDMLDMIRAELQNRQVALQVTVELPPEAPVQKLVGNNERFEMLAAKNPILHEMKRVFDLDTETPH